MAFENEVYQVRSNEIFKKICYIKDLENELFDLIKQERQSTEYNSFLNAKISSLQTEYSLITI